MESFVLHSGNIVGSLNVFTKNKNPIQVSCRTVTV